jgi:hypothetical protein
VGVLLTGRTGRNGERRGFRHDRGADGRCGLAEADGDRVIIGIAADSAA